jgi:hypothetical protein
VVSFFTHILIRDGDLFQPSSDANLDTSVPGLAGSRNAAFSRQSGHFVFGWRVNAALRGRVKVRPIGTLTRPIATAQLSDHRFGRARMQIVVAAGNVDETEIDCRAIATGVWTSESNAHAPK